MKLMHCPLNGPRNISEFVCHGEVVAPPDHARCTDAEWAAYVFLHDNQAGVVREWWMHVPTAYWFIAERDTRSDQILRTYRASEMYSARLDLAPNGRAT
ncbi:MAG: sarcosine oxidase subunit delta [Alphaproteobacteria bacterium]|nr:sarcosine oxidase subunit delta [Alphaproteobacteria bacterium]